MEIEKKFMVTCRPQNLEDYPKKEIEQGYLASNPIVRIRRSNEEYILTYKARLNEKGSDIIINKEIELPLASVLARMELAGVAADEKKLDALSRDMAGKLARWY